MMQKWLLAVFLLLFFWSAGRAQADIFAPMKTAIKAADAKELSKHFNQSVDVNLEGNVNTYSKTQAEFVLRDFFKKHPVTEFEIVHTGSTPGGLKFAIGNYFSAQEKFRVLIRVKQVGDTNLIHEISFVKE